VPNLVRANASGLQAVDMMPDWKNGGIEFGVRTVRVAP
jgi:hypothetical protein